MDFSQYDKSDSIMRGKNVIVLQNLDGFDSKKILIELSTASSSNFDYPEGELEQYDNLDLTAKVVQACLREYYVNCANATTEAAIHIPMYTPFVITVDFVPYHFDDIADFMARKNTLPFSIQTDILRFKDACSDATFEATVKLKPDQPFSITINNGTRYVFENIDDFIAKSRDVFDAEIQPTLFVPKKEIPVKQFSTLTSRPFPIINREEVNITSYQIRESTKYLTLSPSVLDSATVSYAILDASIAVKIPQVYDTISIQMRPTYNDPDTLESHNVSSVNSAFTIFEPQIRSPLKTYVSFKEEEVSVGYSVVGATLRDNLIRGYDDITKVKLDYKVNDVIILDIVQDFTTQIESVKTYNSALDATIREHAAETNNSEDFVYDNFTVLDATTRNQLIFGYTPVEAIKTVTTVLEPTLRNHLNTGRTEVESFDIEYNIPDVIIKKDLHSINNVESVITNNSVLDAYTIRSLHLNYNEVTEVQTQVNIPDPEITGETIVQISCIGAVEQTQDITMNGNFTVYLNDVKLNQQPMSVATLRTLLSAYGIEIEIISE